MHPEQQRFLQGLLLIISISIFTILILSIKKLYTEISTKNRVTTINYWLYMVPLLDIVLGFIIVNDISKSIFNEANANGDKALLLKRDKIISIFWCCLFLFPFFYFLGFLSYWGKLRYITRYMKNERVKRSLLQNI